MVDDEGRHGAEGVVDLSAVAARPVTRRADRCSTALFRGRGRVRRPGRVAGGHDRRAPAAARRWRRRRATPVLSLRRVPALPGPAGRGAPAAGATSTAAFADAGLERRGRAPASSSTTPAAGSLYARQPELALVPASTVKLLTAATVLDRIGADARLVTEVRAGRLAGSGVRRGRPVARRWGRSAARDGRVRGARRAVGPAPGPAIAPGGPGRPDRRGRCAPGAGPPARRRDAGTTRCATCRRGSPSYVEQGQSGPLSALTRQRWLHPTAPDAGRRRAPPRPTPPRRCWPCSSAERGVRVGGVGRGRRARRRGRSSRRSSRCRSVRWSARCCSESDNTTAELLTKELGFRFGGAGSTAAGSGGDPRDGADARPGIVDGAHAQRRLGPRPRQPGDVRRARRAARHDGGDRTRWPRRCRSRRRAARWPNASPGPPPRAGSRPRPARSRVSSRSAGTRRDEQDDALAFAILVNDSAASRGRAARRPRRRRCSSAIRQGPRADGARPRRRREPGSPMFPLAVGAVPVGGVAAARLRAALPRADPAGARRATASSASTLIERGSEVGGGDAGSTIGTRARIVEAAELPDGRWALVAVGVRRIAVVRWLPDEPFPQAEVDDLPEPEPGPGGRRTWRPRQRAAAARARAAGRARRARRRRRRSSWPTTRRRRRSRWRALAPVGPADAQRVLEVASTDERLRLLARLLEEEAEVLEARAAGGMSARARRRRLRFGRHGQQRPGAETSRGIDRAEEKSLATHVTELYELVLAYAKQEALDPVKSLGRFIGFGVAGSLRVRPRRGDHAARRRCARSRPRPAPPCRATGRGRPTASPPAAAR